MASFFLQRDYTLAVVDRALQHVDTIPRDTALRPPNDGQSNREVIPLMLTYNPINHHVKNSLVEPQLWKFLTRLLSTASFSQLEVELF